MPLHGNDFESEFGVGGGLFGNAVNNQAAGGLAGAAPGAGLPTEGIFGAGNLFGKGGGASLALGGLKTLGSIWNSFQQMKLAKNTLRFQKDAFKTNLQNSTQVYNNALEDRIRARYATEGRSDQADAKIDEQRL